MELFRDARRGRPRAVTVVTHATKNLDLADKVCVMGQGGELCFFGPPEEAKRFFGVETYDGIYTALDERPAVEWRRSSRPSGPSSPPSAEVAGAGRGPGPARARAPAAERRPARRRCWRSRYLKLLLRDRRNLALLLGQAPLIALGIALLFQPERLRDRHRQRPDNAALLLFLVVTTAIWLGSIDGSREIIKERALMDARTRVGVKLSAYLASKAVVLFALVAIQCVLLAVVTFGLRPLHESAGAYLGVLVDPRC